VYCFVLIKGHITSAIEQPTVNLYHVHNDQVIFISYKVKGVLC